MLDLGESPGVIHHLPSPEADIISHMDLETVVLQQERHCLSAPERDTLGQFIKKASVPNSVLCSSHVKKNYTSL